MSTAPSMLHFDCQYPNTRRVSYDVVGDGKAVFVPVCMACHRFVKAAPFIRFNGFGILHPEPNAECSKCGPTHMHFEGYV